MHESNDILYDIIYLRILVEKYGQNYKISSGSSIVGWKEYLFMLNGFRYKR